MCDLHSVNRRWKHADPDALFVTVRVDCVISAAWIYLAPGVVQEASFITLTRPSRLTRSFSGSSLMQRGEISANKAGGEQLAVTLCMTKCLEKN